MLKLNKLFRLIAFALLSDITFQLVFPVYAFALTAGPTAPEYTSFEPVDTSDMVNLGSGDFTYNIPLLEVPGPEGSYPVSLSYHAGIMPDEEASWVGLGWTLNTGAINRAINGYPDDQKGAKRTVVDDWKGGERSTYTVGVGYAGVSYNLSYSEDTYQGTGVGMSVGVSVPVGGGPVGIGGTMGVDAYGSPYAGLSVGMTAGSAEGSSFALGGSIGVSTNFSDVSGNAGVGISARSGKHSQSLMGASISTNSLKPNLSVLGAGGQANNHKAGQISSYGYGFTIPIPIGTTGAHVNLGYNYLRYWSSTRNDMFAYGVLYASFPLNFVNENAFDSYAIPDPEGPEGIVGEPDKNMGGSLPAYDRYNVSAQGLGGSIQPYIFEEASFYRQDVRNEDLKNIVKYLRTDKEFKKKVNFRFKNDFSNSLVKEMPDLNSISHADIRNPLNVTLKDQLVEEEGFNEEDNHLAGSKHIEWFTNLEISNGEAYRKGFYTHEVHYSERPLITHGRDVSNQVGGFMITNETGVTYHYSLPVYNYKEYSKFITDDEKSYREEYNNQPYAYTWLLTAVTGPDYVDRFEDDGASSGYSLTEDDWGYWVKFEYGLWADNYQWRNPSVGMHKDLDRKSNFYSRGKKELYYLDAVRTRTHTALFEKEIRKDGKSVTNDYSGGFSIKTLWNSYEDPNCQGNDDDQYDCTLEYQSFLFPTSPLKLRNIYLLTNKDYNSLGGKNIKSLSDNYSHTFLYDNNEEGQYYDETEVTVHQGQNVVDLHDLEMIREDLTDRSQRIIEFSHDYKLVPETPNSFHVSYEEDPSTDDMNAHQNLSGKLTLNSLRFLGRKGEGAVPPLKFTYDTPNTAKLLSSYIRRGAVRDRAAKHTMYADGVNVGDIVSYKHKDENNEEKTYYCLLERYSGDPKNKQFVLKYIGKNERGNMRQEDIYGLRITKNPPYNKDFRDIWGMYKSDFVDVGIEDISRLPTSLSAQSVDAWSLRKIETSLGSAISVNYESDAYREATLYQSYSLHIKDMEQVEGTEDEVKIILHDEIDNLERYITNQGEVSVIALTAYEETKVIEHSTCFGTIQKIEKKKGLIEEQHLQVKNVYFDEVSQKWKLHVVGAGLYDSLNPEDYSYNTETETYYYSTQSGGCVKVCNSSGSNTCQEREVIKRTRKTYTEKTVLGGNLKINQDVTKTGGGLRVSSLQVYEPINAITYTTEYKYQKFDDPKNVSGVTSFEPTGLDYSKLTYVESYDDQEFIKETNEFYDEQLFKKLSTLLALNREVPSPGVAYENVEVRDFVQHGNEARKELPGKKQYFFEVFNTEMYERDPIPKDYVETIQEQDIINEFGETEKVKVEQRTVTLRDYSSRMGNLQKTITYAGDGSKLLEEETRYLHDNRDNGTFAQKLKDEFRNQGRIDQLFLEYKITDKNTDKDTDSDEPRSLQFIVTKKEEYPTVMTGSWAKNHKTKVETQSRNLAFDYFTGKPTQVLTEDSYGNRFIAENVPAYHFYGNMGLKVHDITNKNMLAQGAFSATYKVDTKDEPIRLVSADVQTWSDKLDVLGIGRQEGIFRKHASYTWTGDAAIENDGLYAYEAFKVDPFTAWNSEEEPAVSSRWRKNGEVTFYDVYSHGLEAKDLNGNYSASRMDSKQGLVIASAVNAKYVELAFSGAEEFDMNDEVAEVKMGDPAGVNLEFAHTGAYSLPLNKDEKCFVYTASVGEGVDQLEPGRLYRASAWVNLRDDSGEDSQMDNALLYYIDGAGNKVTASAADIEVKAGDWYLINLDLGPFTAGQEIEVGCTSSSEQTMYFDDFRFHPMDASVSSFVYDQETTKLTHILGNDNFYTRFEYDAQGRLKATYQEIMYSTEHQLSSQQYHYGRESGK